MAESLYFPYLLMLLLVPVLVRWRWGLIAALGVTVAELGLVILVFYLMASYHLLPDLHVGEPSAEHPFAKIRRGQAEGYDFYAGWPNAVGAVAIAREVFAQK